jgi:hypothetical protein
MSTNINQTLPRIITDITLFFVVLYAPWWCMFAALFLGVWYFKKFYEAFFFGLLFDMLYGANIASLHGFRFIFSSAFLVLIFLADFVKEKVRM